MAKGRKTGGLIEKEISGEKYGLLTAIRRVGGVDVIKYECLCECGNKTIVVKSKLINGHTKSCGCLKEAQKTCCGRGKTPLAGVWRAMKDRCYNKKNSRYNDWGGKGITICDEWTSSFINFEKWSLANGYKKGLTIDRINNDKGYSPENCRWSTHKEQQRNKTSNRMIEYNGQTKPLCQWCDELSLPYNTCLWRIKKGWSISDVFGKPIKKKDNNMIEKKELKEKITRGRPTVMTSEKIDELRHSFLAGMTDREACVYVGIGLSTLGDYCRDNPEFATQKEEWKQNPIAKAKMSVFKGLKDPNLALKYLERKCKDEFSTKTEQKHTGGVSLVVIDRDDEDL